MSEPVFDWLVTYTLHSTLLLGGAMILAATVIRRHVLRDLLWKVALVGALISATLPGMIGHRPLLGVLSPSPAAAAPDDRGLRYAWTPGVEADPLPIKGVGEKSSTVDRPPLPASSSRTTARVVVGAWLLIATLLVGRLCTRYLLIRRSLRDRQVQRQGPVPQSLEELGRRAGLRRVPRVSVHAACPTPMALSSREICVPPRFLSALSADEQRAALAHELAHVARRDPVWQLTGSLVQCVFFFQPLHRLALVKWQEAAEYNCDAWAVRQTGDSLSLARCLRNVGSWLVEPTATDPPGAAAMVHRRSPLVSRIARLTRVRPEAVARVGLTSIVAMFCVMATFVMAAPTIRLSPEIRGTDYEWSATLPAGNQIEIKAVTGDIRITSSPTDQVVVRATAEGSDADEILYQAVEHAAGVTICSVFPPTPGMPENVCEPGRWRVHSSTASARVDFEIQIPPAARVAARTMTGDILVEHPGSAVVARTTTGNVVIVLDDPAWSGQVDVANTSGDMAVWVPPGAALRLRARSEHAQVTSEIPVRDLPVAGSSPQLLDAELGEASPNGTILLSSVWGAIEFRDATRRR